MNKPYPRGREGRSTSAAGIHSPFPSVYCDMTALQPHVQMSLTLTCKL